MTKRLSSLSVCLIKACIFKTQLCIVSFLPRISIMPWSVLLSEKISLYDSSLCTISMQIALDGVQLYQWGAFTEAKDRCSKKNFIVSHHPENLVRESLDKRRFLPSRDRCTSLGTGWQYGHARKKYLNRKKRQRGDSKTRKMWSFKDCINRHDIYYMTDQVVVAVAVVGLCQ